MRDEALCRATNFMEKELKTSEMFTRNSALLVMHLLLGYMRYPHACRDR